MQNSNSGGASDIDVNEFAVSPTAVPATRVEITVTPVAYRLSALRKSLTSWDTR